MAHIIGSRKGIEKSGVVGLCRAWCLLVVEEVDEYSHVSRHSLARSARFLPPHRNRCSVYTEHARSTPSSVHLTHLQARAQYFSKPCSRQLIHPVFASFLKLTRTFAGPPWHGIDRLAAFSK
jgi:hypothetical protein